jgi:hypothetical protein
MAENFKALVKEQKETNKKLDQLVAATDPSGSAAKEVTTEKNIQDTKRTNLLKKIASGITGMWGNLKDVAKAKLKGAGKGLMALLKGIALAGFLVAVLAFLESKYWTDTKKFIVDTIVPKLEGLFIFLKDNWKEIAIGIGLLAAAFLVFKGIMVAGKIITVITGISTGFAAVGTFFSATLAPAVAGFMVPLLPIVAIVAAIALTLKALWDAFEDFTTTLDETGSIGEALKVGIAKFMGTILGFIPALILDLVGWVAGLFGFDDFKEKVQAIDPIQWISDTIKGLFDKIQAWFKLLFADPVTTLKALWTEALGTFKSLTDMLFWPVNKAIAWVQKLFGWGDPEEPFTVQIFISDMFGKVKTWFTNLFKWASTEDDSDSFVIKTIKGVVDTVKIWLGNMFSFDSTSDIIASAFNVLTFFPNMVLAGIRSASKWLLKLFGFDEAAEKVANADNWTIGGLVVKAFTSIKDWFLGIFDWKKTEPKEGEEEFSIGQMLSDLWKDIKTALSDIFPSLDDIKAMLPSLSDVGATIKGWFGLGGDDAEATAQTPATGSRTGGGPPGAAAGGWMSGGRPTMVGELGPELIFPATGGQVMNAQRTAQIQAAGLRRGAMGQGGGPSIVNAPVNTVNNSQSNTTVTSTELKHPNPLLASVNLAA